MKFDGRMLALGGAVIAASLLAGATDADARGRRGRRNAHFKSQPAPARSRTPALGADGAADSSGAGPVAGSALEGSFRQEVIDGGALLAMGPGRALLLNSYRGLSLVDTSDPSAPRVLASVAVDGTGQRMFLGTDEVAVLSVEWDESGAHTLVTSVAIGTSSLTVAGTVTVDGWLTDAVREGDDLLLVSGGGWYGPMMYADMAGAGPANGMTEPKRRRQPARRSHLGRAKSANGGVAPDMMIPWYGGDATSHVARVRIAADGAPSLLGTIDVKGSLLAHALRATDAVLAVQDWNWDPRMMGGNDPSDSTVWTPPVVSLLRVADGANGAPVAGATLDLTGVSGVSALDRDGDTLRAVEWTEAGQSLATFDLSGGAIAAEDSLTLGDWPYAFAFSGGAFVYGTTEWTHEDLPKDPVFDPDGVADAFGGMSNTTKRTSPEVVTGPDSTLHVVDLRDPSSLVNGGTLSLGSGWIGGITPAPGGVVTAMYGYDETGSSTTIARIDSSDPAAPAIAGSLTNDGYLSPGPVLGDLLLLNGGETDESGSFLPTTQLVDLANGGLVKGGAFDSPSWTSDVARDGNLLGLAAYDRLTLVDVTNVAAPAVRGELRLLVNVSGFAALDATTGAALTTDYLGGDVEIRTVSLPSADALTPLDVLKVGTGDAQMYAAAPYLYVVATDWRTGRSTVHVVDASDPSNLVARGSLDLASYPGQVFLKGEALLLLREAYTLFETNDAGKTKSSSDAFGRCPKSWLRDEFTAVLDVVDLSDPDRPTAAERLRMRWDFAGQALLAGDSLYVPSYVDVTEADDEWQQYAYQIREIDVSDPLDPRANAAAEVPGTLVAATGDAHRVLTADYAWDEATGRTTSTLHLVDLSLGWRERVLASRELSGYPETVTASGGFVHVTTQDWGGIVSSAGGVAGNDVTATAQLLTFDLAGASLSLTSEIDRERGAWAGQVAGGCLFLRTWGWTGALDVYSLVSPAAPRFVASQDVAGVAGDVTVVGGRGYVPAGLYGVASFDLAK